MCHTYFNLLSLFFPSNATVTTVNVTVGHAIPYHADLLFKQYKVGHGIFSLQAKEAKHSGVKDDLTLTNRSTVSSPGGKWRQVMRSSHVRSFFLPEHQPLPSSYISHYQSRPPAHCSQSKYCKCGRDKNKDELTYEFCLSSIEVVSCANRRTFTDSILSALKPMVCKKCNVRFADSSQLSSHSKFCSVAVARSSEINPGAMTVPS